jgi:hypothetical protein
MISLQNVQSFLFTYARNMLITWSSVLFSAVKKNSVPCGFHHLRELAHFHGEGTGWEIISGLREWQANHMEPHPSLATA